MLFRLIIGITFLVSLTNAVAREKLTVGLFDSAPFAFQEKGVVKGITKDLAHQVLSRDFDVKYVVLPYSRVIKFIKNGKIDIAIMYSNKKISSSSQQIGMTLGNDNIVVSFKKNGIKFIENIEGKTVGAIRGANYGAKFEGLKLNRYGVHNYKQSIELLKSRRVDAIIISSAAWKYYFKSFKLNESDFNKVFINFTQNTIYGRKGLSSETIKKIQGLNEALIKKLPSKKLDSLL